jgi:hypothetical protein
VAREEGGLLRILNLVATMRGAATLALRPGYSILVGVALPRAA